MLQPGLVVSYQQSDQGRALAFAQNVSLITVCAVVNVVPRGKNTCISFRWRLATTFITTLATVMLLSRVTGVLPNTRHCSQISQLISQLGKGIWSEQESLCYLPHSPASCSETSDSLSTPSMTRERETLGALHGRECFFLP